MGLVTEEFVVAGDWAGECSKKFDIVERAGSVVSPLDSDSLSLFYTPPTIMPAGQIWRFLWSVFVSSE